MPGRQRVTYEVACLFLLLWACLIAHQGFVVSARVRGNTTHLLQIRDRFRFFACFLFLHMALHGMAVRGGVYVRGLPALFYLDLFCKWRSCRARQEISIIVCDKAWLPIGLVLLFLVVIVHDMWCQWWSIAFLTLSTFGPVPTYSIKGWTGSNKYSYPCNGCRSFTNKMWPVLQFYFSNMSRSVQFQLESGYQVLPPCRRWDLCQCQLRALQRKDRSFKVVGRELWRCRAQEFLLGLWRDFEMAVGSGRSTLGDQLYGLKIKKNRRDFHRFS